MNEHFREALSRLDIPLIQKLWKHVMPHLPQPASADETLITAHLARTAADSIRFRLRAYSHAWLSERGLPSQLPDTLRPKAERLYPTIVATVGIATYTRTPIALAIRGAMEDAVRDAGVQDPELTKRAILSARAKARKKLLGIV